MDKKKVFKRLLDAFETEEYRAYCEDMIMEIPGYIFEIPSSTSMKYHNATQCKPHGQLYHILMFGEIMNYILNLEYVKIKTTTEERDQLRCSPIFHDAIKCGLNGSKFTVFEHPMLAAEWVLKTKVAHDISREAKETIARYCAAHSGEWTTNKRSSTVLPAPANDKEFLVHLCDYLSSRSNLDMMYDDELVNELSDVDPLDYVMPFGKYVGKTIKEIKEIDMQYLIWAKANVDKEPLKTYLNSL